MSAKMGEVRSSPEETVYLIIGTESNAKEEL
jgi:hypothetical protein